MLTTFQWISLISILLVTFAGGYFPLFHQKRARRAKGFPFGEVFTAGVFLALSVTLMLPSASHLFNKAFPEVDYPIASILLVAAFLFLLCMEHLANRTKEISEPTEYNLTPASIPIIMTVMIAIPSFFLGAALGVSETSSAVFISVAIMIHKSSAAFALSLKMVRSTLTKKHTFVLFSMFALSTPLGIFFGQEIHLYLSSYTMIVVKGFILSLAAGTFLYMSTLHEFENAPLIKYCGNKKGFLLMFYGFAITAFARLLIGEAYHL